MRRRAWSRPLQRASGPLPPDCEDVIGFRVTDVAGEALGTVRGVFIDPAARRPRFIEVRGDPVLGLDESEYLIPTEAIIRSVPGLVRLGHARAMVQLAPQYDPDRITDPSQWGDLYAWYGYVPYWALALRAGDHLQRTGRRTPQTSVGRRSVAVDRSRADAAEGAPE